MKKYFISVRSLSNSIHLVHSEGCPFMPSNDRVVSLGIFGTDSEATVAGRKIFSESAGCRFCNSGSEVMHHGSVQVLENNIITGAELRLCEMVN